jgi:hypothetical protein
MLPLSYTDVYVDDFCNLIQGNACRCRVARHILFHKLLKGDGCWATTKLLLGWIIDTVCQTLELPPHRYKRLCSIFDDLHGAKRPSLKAWQKVLGELGFDPASHLPIGQVGLRLENIFALIKRRS